MGGPRLGEIMANVGKQRPVVRVDFLQISEQKGFDMKT
jgi:hypothetical protein